MGRRGRGDTLVHVEFVHRGGVLALPTQCPFCATITVVADVDVVHRFGARRYRCPSCESIAVVSGDPSRPPGRLLGEAPPLGVGDLAQLRALLDDENWLAAPAGRGGR
jgi:hypothetical protein